MMRDLRLPLVVTLAVLGVLAESAWLLAQDFDRSPIRYSESTPANAISRLQERLDSGQTKLTHDPAHGYLVSVLKALEIDIDSQTLVFSKSSVQARYISQKTPRAIYFSDDVYLGWPQSGNALEISAVDPQLGAVFYTLDQSPTDNPKFTRQGDACLNCHSAARIGGIPGHIVRSHIVDEGGHVIPSAGIVDVDYTTPLAKRWGGWYVTGTSGAQAHLGNFFARGYQVPDPIDNSAGENVTSLEDRFDVKPYLSPTSDIVALMVMEYQALAENRMTRANFVTRQALDLDQQFPRPAGQEEGTLLPTTIRTIQRAGDELVDALLFVGEAKLTAPIKGVSGFSESFARKGPRDGSGRSLREFDLNQRLFRYPCSYLIYSDSFNQLPTEVRDYVWQQLADILTAEKPPEKFSHLSAGDRQAIVEILRDTIADLPKSFQ
jgi:hypothetical protein